MLIDAATKHGHGPAGTRRAGGYVGSDKVSQGRGKERDRAPEEGGDVGGQDMAPRIVRSHAIRVQGCCGGGARAA